MMVEYGKQDSTATKTVGVYPCCQQRVLRFDPSSEGSVSTSLAKKSKIIMFLVYCLIAVVSAPPPPLVLFVYEGEGRS